MHVERRTMGRYSRKEVPAPGPDPGRGHSGHSPDPGPEPDPGPGLDPGRWRPAGTYDKHVRAASGQRPALFELEGPGGLLISHHVRGAAAFAAAVAAQQPAVQRAAALRLDCRPFNASIERASLSAFPAQLHAWRSCTRAVCRRGLAWPGQHTGAACRRGRRRGAARLPATPRSCRRRRPLPVSPHPAPSARRHARLRVLIGAAADGLLRADPRAGRLRARHQGRVELDGARHRRLRRLRRAVPRLRALPLRVVLAAARGLLVVPHVRDVRPEDAVGGLHIRNRRCQLQCAACSGVARCRDAPFPPPPRDCTLYKVRRIIYYMGSIHYELCACAGTTLL